MSSFYFYRRIPLLSCGSLKTGKSFRRDENEINNLLFQEVARLILTRHFWIDYDSDFCRRDGGKIGEGSLKRGLLHC